MSGQDRKLDASDASIDVGRENSEVPFLDGYDRDWTSSGELIQDQPPPRVGFRTQHEMEVTCRESESSGSISRPPSRELSLDMGSFASDSEVAFLEIYRPRGDTEPEGQNPESVRQLTDSPKKPCTPALTVDFTPRTSIHTSGGCMHDMPPVTLEERRSSDLRRASTQDATHEFQELGLRLGGAFNRSLRPLHKQVFA